MKLKLVATVGAAVLMGVVVASAPVQAAHKCAAMHGVDINHDNVLSKWEIARAAKRTFRKINPDGDWTLERDELRGRMGPRAFASVNKNNDRGIDAGEYKRYVKSLFYRLNPDGDRTLECDEVSNRVGRRMMRLLN